MPLTSVSSRLQDAVRLYHEIKRGGYPNASDLAKKLELSPKTVRKYLGLLRDNYGVQVEYVSEEHGYEIVAGSANALLPRLTEHEIAAVFLLEEAARGLRGSPVQATLESVLGKLQMLLPPQSHVTLPDLAEALSLREQRVALYGQEESKKLEALNQAIVGRQVLEISYLSHSKEERTRRRIHPLHLTRCEGQWYLLAYCQLREGYRVFVPTRIEDMQVLAERFQRPVDFDPQRHFQHAFGIVMEGQVEQVELLFTPKAGRFIMERLIHGTQELSVRPDGAVSLCMTCSLGEELYRWLLSWSGQVEILRPKRLKTEIVRRLTKTLQNIQDK
jgi:predicted DNA-binding transcriptional regulator YafY